MNGNMQINSKTGILGLFGNPSRHSLSPYIQNSFLYHYKINCIYITFEPDTESIKEVFESAKKLKFKGLNITMPFKEEVFKLVDRAEEAAKTIKAVNTVKFDYIDKGENKTLSTGFSTDGDGVIKSIEDKGFSWQKKTCFIIGAGGAAKSAVLSLSQKPVKTIYIYDIIPGKAEKLAGLIPSGTVKSPPEIIVCTKLTEIEKIYEAIDLIINCSPAGMRIENSRKNEKIIPVPASWNLRGKYVFDMVYSPADTFFLRKARSDGATVIIPGTDLLVNQAAFSFKIWFGIMPENKIISEVKKNISVFLP